MTDWLSSTWGPSWRSFQYFNLYRLLLAGFFLLAILFPHEWTGRLNLLPSPALLVVTGGYMLAVIAGLLLSMHWLNRFNFQLSLQVSVDVLVVSQLMYLAGGVSSGLGILLIVSLAAASLVGRGRLVLFYAAIATLAVLLSQIYGVVANDFDQTSIVQAGLISAGFFATAILARLLGQRAMVNEELARRRGEALENQILISQRVVERMQDGVLIVKPDGAIGRHNPVAEEMLGLSGDTAGLRIDSVPPLAEALQAWKVSGDRQGAQFCGAGNCELRARFERTASSDGEVLIFLEDVGRIKERAQQLKLASLGRLTASIAHEIRNPLSAISHAGELLREERRGEIQNRLLNILNDNVGRLDRIVKDILELGRQNRAQPELLALDDFCRDFVEHFERTEGLSSGAVRLDEPAPAMSICFDRSHLHQVLWNLVSNALRHSTRGPGAVRIALVGASEDERVELHVLDDGSGVAASVREQIFEPFFTTHHQGTGLGLFIARELCVANGASLELVSPSSYGHFILAGRNDTCQLPEANDGRAES